MSQLLAPNLPINASFAVDGVKQFDDSLDLSQKNSINPIYRYRRLTQISGGTTVNIQDTAQTQSIFNIPAQVFNPDKCYMEFDFNATASTALSMPFLWGDQCPIDQIELKTDSGTQLALLQNVAPYTKLVRPLMTDIDDFQSQEAAVGGISLAAANYTTNNFMQPGINQQATTGTIQVSELCTGYPVAVIAGTTPTTLSASNSGGNSAVTIATSGVDKAYTSPQRMVVGGSAAAQIFHCRIPFSAFKGTMMSMNKNMYFGQNLQLTIAWSGLNKWGSQVVYNNIAAAPTALNTGCTLSNLFLWLAVDTNLQTRSLIMDEVNTNGVSVLIPFTNCTSLTSAASAATTFRFSTILPPGAGLTLKRVITVPINVVDTNANSSNSDNSPNATPANIKWSNVQSFLNSAPLQDLPLVDFDGQVWSYLRNMVKGTAVGQSNRLYRINAFWCDNFADSKNGASWNDEDLKYSGLALGTATQVYDVQFAQTCTAGLKYLQYQTYLRRLYIKPSGISY